MSDVLIVDSAIACALNDPPCESPISEEMGHPSLEEVWPQLCRGESAIGPVRSFGTDRLEYHEAACIGDLQAGSAPNRICALANQVVGQLRAVPDGTFVIWSGVKGNAEYLEAQAAEVTASPIFLPRQYRRWVCRRLGIEDRGMEVNAACASSTVALAVGAEIITQGEYGTVLVCAADIVSRFTFTGFAALRALSPSTCRPFDADRDGLSLGDGAAAMLLASPSSAAKLGHPPQARLSGWGIANDANHITGPAQDGSGLITAVRQALKRAGLGPDRLEAWCAHGTGTVYNDAMELTALEEVFGPRRFPLFSIKGAIGHTLGAAGALEAAISVKALREGLVPATSGLRTPDERAAGRVAPVSQSFAGDNILTTNSGFGGVNAALVFEAPDGGARVGTTVLENDS